MRRINLQRTLIPEDGACFVAQLEAGVANVVIQRRALLSGFGNLLPGIGSVLPAALGVGGYALFPQVAMDYFKYRDAQQTGIDATKGDTENKAYPV